jgi:hypothetical protein
VDDVVVYEIDWRGALDFELEREQQREERSLCPRQSAGGNPDLSGPPQRGCNIDGTPVARLGPEPEQEPAKLTGTGMPAMRMQMRFEEADLRLAQDAASEAPVALAMAAERDDATKRLESISLQGTPGQFRATSTLTGSDESSTFSADSRVSGAGTGSVRGQMQSESGSATIEGTLSDGQMRQRYEGVDRRGNRRAGENSAAIPGLNQDLRTMFRLVIETRECGEIGGRVESQELRDQASAGGMAFGVVVSQWHAGHAERDEDLERAVERWVSESVRNVNPGDPDGAWDTWDREWQFYSSLRGTEPPTDYELCVLTPAHAKMIDTSALVLRALLESPIRDAPWMKERMWRIMSVIQGFGWDTFAACPVVRDASRFLFGVTPAQPPAP